MKNEAALREHRHDLLQFGAAGQLYMKGEVEEILPLDDAKLLKAAKPIDDEGAVRYDKEKIEAREDAMIRKMLEKVFIPIRPQCFRLPIQTAFL